MRITKISLSNIANFEDLEFEAGQFNRIEGPNGSGKSTIIKAIVSALKKPEATLLRKGAAKGEIVILLDDGYNVRVGITPAGTSVAVKDGKGFKAGSPRDVLDKLVNAFSINPIEFIRAEPKKRLEVLLNIVKLHISDLQIQRLREIGPIGVPDDKTIRRDPLAEIKKIRKAVFEERTSVNRVVKEKRTTAQGLLEHLPSDLDGEPSEEIAKLETRIEADRQRLDDAYAAAIEVYDKWVRSAKVESEARVAQERNKVQLEIDKLNKRLNDFIAKETTTYTDALRLEQVEVTKKKEIASKEIQPEIDAANQRIAALRERDKSLAAHRANRKTANQMISEAKAQEEVSENLTDGLAAIDEMLKSLLSKLPGGLDIVDGLLCKDGIPFDSLNTQQQFDISIAVVKEAAGDLPVVCADGIEVYDDEHAALFESRCRESNLQLFVTKVNSAPKLTISSN